VTSQASSCQRCGQPTRKPEHTLCVACWVKRSRILDCRSCGSSLTVLDGASGPHGGAVRCLSCGSHRWLSLKDVQFLSQVNRVPSVVTGGARPENR